jgi:hypothetical protein
VPNRAPLFAVAPRTRSSTAPRGPDDEHVGVGWTSVEPCGGRGEAARGVGGDDEAGGAAQWRAPEAREGYHDRALDGQLSGCSRRDGLRFAARIC